MGFIYDFLTGLNFFDLMNSLYIGSFFTLIFPFMLVFSLLFTALGKVKIFQNKKTGESYKSIILVISVIISFYGVIFEVSPGRSIGDLMMSLFPNISALTIGMLSLYIVGSIFGKNFFKGLFSEKHSSFLYLTGGAIGLGAVLFYVGIAMGFWQYDIIDSTGYWSFIIAVALLILGIVFLIIGYIGVGALFLIVLGTFVSNSAQGNILNYFLDPVVFIVVIIIFLMSWMNFGKEAKDKLRSDIYKAETAKSDYKKELGHDPEPYESRIHDIIDDGYKSNKKKWEEKYGDEKW